MTFYINKVHISDSDWEHECIGLFDKENWVGEGNFVAGMVQNIIKIQH